MGETGVRIGYRPKPADFRAQFIEHGWALKDVLNIHTRMVSRWLDSEDRETLLAERAAYVAHKKRSRAKNYMMGRRLTDRP